MARVTHPSNLELQALSVLWHDGPSTVSAVLETLPDGKDRAYTTVLSVLQSLERKKLVKVCCAPDPPEHLLGAPRPASISTCRAR